MACEKSRQNFAPVSLIKRLISSGVMPCSSRLVCEQYPGRFSTVRRASPNALNWRILSSRYFSPRQSPGCRIIISAPSISANCCDDMSLCRLLSNSSGLEISSFCTACGAWITAKTPPNAALTAACVSSNVSGRAQF